MLLKSYSGMEDFKFAFGLNTFKGLTEIDNTYI